MRVHYGIENAAGSVQYDQAVSAAHPLPVTGAISAVTSAVATAAAPTYVEGSTNALSTDLAGGIRVTGSFSTSTLDMLNQTGSVSSATVLFTKTDCTGYFSVSVQLTAFSAGSAMVAEASNDGTTWVILSDLLAGTSSVTGIGETLYNCYAKQFRFRCSVYAGGGSNTANAQFRGGIYNGVPSGGATAALQTSGNSTLGAINTTLGAPMQQTGGSVGLAAGSAVIGHVINDAGSAIIGKIGIDQTTPGTTNAVLATNLPATVDTNSGAKSASTLRVVLATDQPALTAALKVDGSAVTQPVSGTFWQATQPVSISGNQAVNVGQINGVTPLMGAGNTGTGSHRITVSTDQAALATWGHGATAAAVPANAAYKGLIGKTANPTAVSDGQLVGAMADKLGRQAVVPHQIRDLVGDQTTSTIVDTTVTTIVSAVASTFCDIVSLVFSNAGTATTVTIKDNTTARLTFYLPANDTRGVSFPVPFKQAAVNNNWTATCTGTPSVIVTTQFVKNI